MEQRRWKDGGEKMEGRRREDGRTEERRWKDRGKKMDLHRLGRTDDRRKRTVDAGMSRIATHSTSIRGRGRGILFAKGGGMFC